MAKHHRVHIVIEDLGEKLSRIFVGKMTSVPQDSLFQVIGITPYLKHIDIVIRFQKDCIKSFQVLDDIIVIITQVRTHSHRMLLVGHPVSHGLRRIMRDTEG